VQTSGTLSAPVVGSTAANIDIVLRLAISNSGGTQTGKIEICQLATTTTPNAQSLVVTFTPAVLATLNATATQPTPTVNVGGPVPVPPFTILSGINASNAQVDADGDGNPGVTIPANIGGLIQVDAYTGLTIDIGLTATLQNASTITGTTAFATDGLVFGSSNPALLSSGTISVTPSSNAVPFSASKLAGDVPCSQVLSQL
jgi:hypothetical protein